MLIGAESMEQNYEIQYVKPKQHIEKPKSTHTISAVPVKKNEIINLSNEDIRKIKPNEAGKIMVVMFHNFVDEFKPSKYDNGEYTTTFIAFERLLEELYQKGYRLGNVNDFLNNEMDVPAGTMPIMFTFDDGTSGQFNLINQNGELVANPKSAVGILEKFNEKHPDFGIKGTFYVNLGLGVFDGYGTVAERLKYLTDKGFEIGNHTYTHIHLNQAKTADEIQREIGENQKKMLEYISGYNFTSFALPFGQASKMLKTFVEAGEYRGVKYKNSAIMEVGAGPTISPIHKNSMPLSMSRVRASGISAVECDLAWWIKHLRRDEQYISDGNPKTVTIPNKLIQKIDESRLKGKKLLSY